MLQKHIPVLEDVYLILWLYPTPLRKLLQGPLSKQHDSVSTVAFKFETCHLFHIFKFDVQDFRLRATWQVFWSFSGMLVIPWRLKHYLDIVSRIKDQVSQKVRKSKGYKLFCLASKPCDLYWIDGCFKHVKNKSSWINSLSPSIGYGL